MVPVNPSWPELEVCMDFGWSTDLLLITLKTWPLQQSHHRIQGPNKRLILASAIALCMVERPLLLFPDQPLRKKLSSLEYQCAYM